MDCRTKPPRFAIAWRGVRTACDGDGGSGGRADAGRALREAGPGAGKGEERQRRTGRPGAARGGVSGAASGRRSRPGAGGAGRAHRRAVPLREGTASAKTGSEMRGEERGGARTRMGSRAGGGDGGSYPAEPTSAARPPRPGFAERPRISERRVLEARSMRTSGAGFHMRNGAEARFAGLGEVCGVKKWGLSSARGR